MLKLKRAFGSQYGLEDPLLLRHFPEGVSKKKQFIRVLHSNRDHWVVLTTFHSNPYNAILYDSYHRKSLDAELQFTIKNTLCLNENDERITIEWRKTQMQSGRWQCGYYACANAMALCLGMRPEDLVLNESILREHFINVIFYNKDLVMFPHTLKKSNKKSTLFNISLKE